MKTICRSLAVAAFGLAAASAQTFDTSGNGMLNGTFHFRHVAVQNVDVSNNPTDITAVYGTITFNGTGSYTVSATSIDPTVSSGAPQSLSLTAAYAIGANGIGYLTNPLYPTDPDSFIYGAVAQGVFVGSSTESEDDGNILNDIFVAIPAGTAPTNGSFTSAYQTGLLDFTGAGSTAIKNALFTLAPNGSGGFAKISLTGQAANQSAASLTQTITGAVYNFNSDGSATLTIPVATGVTPANALFSGTKTIFESADSNFILGWSTGGYDIFFGVKALSVAGTNSLTGGLYITAALEDNPQASGTDSYYGSTKNFGNSNGDGIVHQRLNVPSGNSYDYGSDNQISVSSNGSAGPDFDGYDYLFGDSGKAFVAIGTNGNFSLVVGMQFPNFTGSGVYLNPVGIVNAASYQPVTASIAPGELLTLFGSGLASSTVTAPVGSFPTKLGGVSATIDGLPCPIFYVSPGQMAITVPYPVALNQTGLANIQITNNGVASNIVQMYLTDGAPGSFSQNLTGIGLAAALHASNNQEITAANPVQPGEYLSLYLTGLGTVTPSIADGTPGPSSPLSYSDIYDAGNLSVYFNDYTNGSSGNPGTIQYAGLAPYLVGLYQINVQVPTSGLVAGDNIYVEFVTDAADVNQIQLPYGAGTAAPASVYAARAASIKAASTRIKTRHGKKVHRSGEPTAESTGNR